MKLFYAFFRASPMASITIRNLLLYTTNENWEVTFENHFGVSCIFVALGAFISYIILI